MAERNMIPGLHGAAGCAFELTRDLSSDPCTRHGCTWPMGACAHVLGVPPTEGG